MKTTVITDLPMIPEEYAQENYERIDWSDVDSEMSDGQRRFIHGLVQYYQPNKILELGVSAGGGTVVLLNALQENEKAELYSVDSATQFYRDPDLPVGHCALKKYSDLLNKKWHLFTGEDPACVMDKIEEKFDFCVIDTYHLHPVETLNFISILPWLMDGAVVVMHDTTAFEWRTQNTFLRMLAPRMLLSAVCAEKYIPDLPSGNMQVSNIASWQINADTRKYCQNLFDILYLPWETAISKNTCQNIRELVYKHYSDKMRYYDEAVKINRSMFLAKEYGVLNFETAYKKLKKNTIFYGAGFQMKKLLITLDFCDVEFDFEIWDQNADKIQIIDGYTVKMPDWDKKAQSSQVMIVMIENNEIYEDINKRFKKLGYILFHKIEGYLSLS